MRFVDVTLYDNVIFRLDHARITRQKDTSTLALVLRLDYESPSVLLFLLANVLAEVFVVMRHHICLRKKVVLSRHKALHLIESTTKHILLGNRIHTWKVVNSLVKLHSL